MKSDNLLTEEDPYAVRFEMLPRGDKGLRADPQLYGPINEEAVLLPIDSPPGILMYFRTGDGWVGSKVSWDEGETWQDKGFLTYRPGGPRLKHPRGPMTTHVLQSRPGKRLLLFYNNHDVPLNNTGSFLGRFALWATCGVERDSDIVWSQPELIMYDGSWFMSRLGYADIVEDLVGGHIWLIFSNKRWAEKQVVTTTVDHVCGQWSSVPRRTETHVVLSLGPDDPPSGWVPSAQLTPLDDMFGGIGLTIEMVLRLDGSPRTKNFTLIDSRANDTDVGYAITLSSTGRLEVHINDTLNHFSFPLNCPMEPTKSHHVVFLIEGGPKLVFAMINGEICDPEQNNGPTRMYQIVDQSRNDFTIHEQGRLQPSERTVYQRVFQGGRMEHLWLHDRALRVSEVVGNFRKLFPSTSPP
mmetsp:Transcript_10191/g.21622  ORF Transcript_10191/g.21622 Transcript_10191/m.21622 type:complete len:411 (+) Transcript_10191:2-1234(+)